MVRILLGILAITQIIAGAILLIPHLLSPVSAEIKFDTQTGKVWLNSPDTAEVVTDDTLLSPPAIVNNFREEVFNRISH